MAYNLATAAMATGVNKSTILRSIKAGRISATKNDTGWTIEVAELHRVFPPLPTAATGEATAMPRDATVDELVRVLRQQVEDMRQERDRWHAAFEASQQQHTRLLPPPATDNAAVSNQEINALGTGCKRRPDGLPALWHQPAIASASSRNGCAR